MSSAPSALGADELRLAELGYRQELKRGLRVADSAALGFAGISPVVGLYAVVFVGMSVAGPAWFWVLPVALAGQCLLLAVYSELASEFPIAGGAYQWSRRLIGGPYGWFNGWVAVCAYAAANTTVAYLGAPWLLVLLGIDPTPHAIVLAGVGLVLACAAIGSLGINVLAKVVRLGIAAEILASVGIAIALLLAFRTQDVSILGDTLGAEALSGGSVAAGLLAALAVGGWVFIGFDCAVGVAEETTDAARHIPRAIWIALLAVGALVITNAVAVTLAHPDPASVVAGADLDPVTTSVVSLVRLLVRQAVRRARPDGVHRLRCRGAGSHRADDLLDGPRRRGLPASRVPEPRRPPPGPDRRDRGDRPSRHASASCSASSRPPSAA